MEHYIFNNYKFHNFSYNLHNRFFYNYLIWIEVLLFSLFTYLEINLYDFYILLP